MPSIFRAGGIAALVFLTLNFSGCGGEEPAAAPSQSSAASSAPVGKEQKFEWYLESVTPAGESVVVRTGDGKITNESFVHWNNREYTIRDELQLDANGLPSSQRISGTSPFGAPIDESFSLSDGVATWKSVGESGSVSSASGGFYLPNEFGATESLPALVRAALKNLDGQQELIPSGTASVEKLTELTVNGAAGEALVSLYGISGIGFTPTYIWLDDQLESFALDFGGFMGMARKRYGGGVLYLRSREQEKFEARRF